MLRILIPLFFQYLLNHRSDNEEDWITARQFVAERQKFYDRPIVTEVQRLVRFYDAEEEHQDYLVHHPHGYCHVDFSRILPQERKAK